MSANITRLDYFAGLAMQAILGQPDPPDADVRINWDVIAANSWKAAQALEAARPVDPKPDVVPNMIVTKFGHDTRDLWGYTTQAGESATGIAMRELKDESRWREIADLNDHRFPDMLGSDYYPAGTRLTMPPKEKKA